MYICYVYLLCVMYLLYICYVFVMLCYLLFVMFGFREGVMFDRTYVFQRYACGHTDTETSENTNKHAHHDTSLPC